MGVESGAGNPHLSILLLQDDKSENGEREAQSRLFQSLNIGVFNVRGCSTNGVKIGEIGKMFSGGGWMCVL